MKIFSSSFLVPSVLALALASYGAVSFGGETSNQEGKKAPAQEGQDHDHDEGHGHDEDPLHESMEILQQKMRGLRKMLKPTTPEAKAEAIAACQEMEAAVMVSMGHVPKPGNKLEGSDLLKYEIDFKQRMVTVYGTLLDLQLALDAGDADKAKALYRTLGGQKKEGHEIYIDQNGK